MKTLRLYVLRELIPPILLSAAFFTIVLVIVRLLDVADMMLKAGVGGGLILQFLAIVVVTLLALTVPMAVLLGTLIGVGRLTAENEILAIRVAGISIVRVFIPVIASSGLLALALMWSNSYLLPSFVDRIDSLIFRMQFSVLTNLKPGVFYDDLGTSDSELTMYFDSLDDSVASKKDSSALHMKGVNMRMKIKPDNLVVPENGKPNQVDGKKVPRRERKHRDDMEFLIFAESGTIEGTDHQSEILMTLKNGTWVPLNDRDSDVATIIRFDQLENILDAANSDNGGIREVHPQEMNSTELFRRLNNPPTVPVLREESGVGMKMAQVWRRHFALRNELIQRFTLPLSVVAFVLIAIPLAIEIRPRAKAFSLLIAIALMVVYYALFIMAGNISANGIHWILALGLYMLPNVVIGGVGCLLIRRAMWR